MVYSLREITASFRFKMILKTFTKWLKRDEKVLDIGCGNGIISNLLVKNIKIKIICCDIKNYLDYELPFIKLKNGKLPFKEKVFNAALFIDVLHHIDKNNHEKILNEALRVADKVLIFEAKPTFIGKLADIMLNKYHYGDLSQPLSFRHSKEWKTVFKKLSLKFEEINLERPFWYPFSHIAFLIRRM